MAEQQCLTLIQKLRSLPKEVLQNTHYEIKKTLKMFPPAKNENKFTYGLIIQRILINVCHQHIGPTIDLDDNHNVGSEYKNDAQITIDNQQLSFSIKACKNIGSKIIMINKLNASDHDINDINLVTIYTGLGIICATPISLLDPNLIDNNGATVSLKGCYYNRHIKNTEYELQLPELSKKQQQTLDSMTEVNFVNYLYNQFVKTP
jgi:hypothetical protein